MEYEWCQVPKRSRNFPKPPRGTILVKPSRQTIGISDYVVDLSRALLIDAWGAFACVVALRSLCTSSEVPIEEDLTLDAKGGALTATRYAAAGATLRPTSGAAVWSAPTIDVQRQGLYVATVDNYSRLSLGNQRRNSCLILRRAACSGIGRLPPMTASGVVHALENTTLVILQTAHHGSPRRDSRQHSEITIGSLPQLPTFATKSAQS